MKKIAIVGYGYVGKAMYRLFKDHYETGVRDPFLDDTQLPPDIRLKEREDVNKCDLGVVCVPTPRAENGECDIRYVKSVMEWIETPLILLKSTVEIGTTESLKKQTGKRIVFSPEYCGESSYWTPYDFHTDIKETPFFIFGGDKEDTTKMVDIFMKITGPVKTYRQTDSRTAELVKYMENSFYATKIAFCYEMYEVCKTCGIDYNEARDLWLLDPRINPMHTAVFSENEWPFSGKCLPKDISGLVEAAKKKGYDPKLLEEVIRTNKRIHDIRSSV